MPEFVIIDSAESMSELNSLEVAASDAELYGYDINAGWPSNGV